MPMMRPFFLIVAATVGLISLSADHICVESFSSTTPSSKRHIDAVPVQRSNVVVLSLPSQHGPEEKQQHTGIQKFSGGLIIASAVFLSTVTGAFADEYGVEKEAPTLFTGESVMICKKRGPLGACLETVARTEENDNDKAKQYFRDPVVLTKETNADKGDAANELIEKLRQQTEDNKEKNELLVQQKTALNDQSASFGPFDRSVAILNTDGRTFTLLENPQAMRLKDQGYIKDRRFVTQPSQEVIDAALESPDFGKKIMGFFGGGGD